MNRRPSPNIAVRLLVGTVIIVVAIIAFAGLSGAALRYDFSGGDFVVCHRGQPVRYEYRQ